MRYHEVKEHWLLMKPKAAVANLRGGGLEHFEVCEPRGGQAGCGQDGGKG